MAPKHVQHVWCYCEAIQPQPHKVTEAVKRRHTLAAQRLERTSCSMSRPNCPVVHREEPPLNEDAFVQDVYDGFQQDEEEIIINQGSFNDD
jgi:hypothetical protein